jgi:L-galactono-1,4-lactone dehydrogenase
MFKRRLIGFARTSTAAISVVCLAHSTEISDCEVDKNCFVNFESNQVLSNWSSTHSQNAKRIYEPQNLMELQRLLTYHQNNSCKIRPIGTLLSPNGIALPEKDGNVLSMHHFDQVVVNPETMTVTVGAGATVRNVLNALSAHNMTLENFSSIQEQQMAGWTQVAAHGTGCELSTVEEQIVEMKLATPAEGLLTLSSTKLPYVFSMAKVGLGSVGVVTEMTLRCINKLTLREDTVAYSRETIEKEHYDRLKQFRHVRYMWIPYTSCVVSVTSNPVVSGDAAHSDAIRSVLRTSEVHTGAPPTKALIDLILKDSKRQQEVASASKGPTSSATAMHSSPQYLSFQSFAQLRDIALGTNPLSLDHVKRVNAAEAKYWTAAQGTRVGDSTDILGFDCGGEQWVLEMCFPMGSLEEESFADIKFVKELLEVVERTGIAAPGPIEQR